MKIPPRALPVAAKVLTSAQLASATRGAHDLLRLARRGPQAVYWYHDAGCPRASLLTTLLPRLAERYAVTLVPRTIPTPRTPFRYAGAEYATHAFRDARLLAQYYGLTPPRFIPDVDEVDAANAYLTRFESSPADYARAAEDVYAALHTVQVTARFPSSPPTRLNENRREQHRRGHFESGTLCHAGEWFAGIDRLASLERRLEARGLGAGSVLETHPEAIPAESSGELEFFFSFRSPYSYLAFPRVVSLAEHHDLTLRLRPLLPMVARGVALPPLKKRQIILDASREAREHRIPFGYICDPLGSGVERTLAVFHALPQTAQRSFAQAALTAAWARGIDMSTDTGLRKCLSEAGQTSFPVEHDQHAHHWQTHVASNRAAVHRLGLWGVPSLRLGALATWGQDRIPMITAAIANARTREYS